LISSARKLHFQAPNMKFLLLGLPLVMLFVLLFVKSGSGLKTCQDRGWFWTNDPYSGPYNVTFCSECIENWSTEVEAIIETVEASGYTGYRIQMNKNTCMKDCELDSSSTKCESKNK